MNEVVKVAYDAGYQIATHCIGDGANNQMINAYEAAIKANPRDDRTVCALSTSRLWRPLTLTAPSAWEFCLYADHTRYL